MSTGNSGVALAKKLGMDKAERRGVVNPPINYDELIGFTIPRESTIRFGEYSTGVLHYFCTEVEALQHDFPLLKDSIFPDGALWISWPKKSGGFATNLSESIIRELGLATGLVDTKVCAVDEIWSGLKFVFRRENRKIL